MPAATNGLRCLVDRDVFVADRSDVFVAHGLDVFVAHGLDVFVAQRLDVFVADRPRRLAIGVGEACAWL